MLGLGADIAVAGLTDGAQALGITQLAGSDRLEFSLFSDDEFVDVPAGVLPPLAGATGRPFAVERRADVAMSAMWRRRLAEAEHDHTETTAFDTIELGPGSGRLRPVRRAGRVRRAQCVQCGRASRTACGRPAWGRPRTRWPTSAT